VPQQNIILGAVLALASAGSLAQGIWRCGSSYSQQPCTGGSAVAAPLPSPTAAEAAKAMDAARTDAARAEAMEKARLAQEKNAPGAAVIAPEPPAKPVADQRGKKSKPEDFTAVTPGPGKKKKSR